MQCVILAGGLATRLGRVAASVPKTLVPVGGRPFAEHQLGWLAANGVTDLVYCIGHLGEQVRGFVGDGAPWGLRVRYVDEGDRRLGTAGALRLAHDEGALAEQFAVVYGDSYLPIDLPPVWEDFERRRPDALMTVFRNDGRFDRSNARLRADGLVEYDKEATGAARAAMRHIDYGLSVIDRDRVVGELIPGAPADLADVFRSLSRAGRLAGHEVGKRFYEIGSLEGLDELDALLTRRQPVAG